MFIISKNSFAAKTAVNEYRKHLKGLHNHFSEVYEFNLNSLHTLYWFSAKPQDQLHVYTNALVIGKLKFDEAKSDKPIYHNTEFLVEFADLELNTLIHTSIVYYNEETLEVFPNEVVNLYYSSTNISDFQLLIAKAEKLLPSQIGVQILAAVGYFPGNMTLFEEIKKIPYLCKIKNFKIEKVSDFNPQKHDDKKLLKRLSEIVPKNDKQSLAMSGGLDSRFVLGILLNSGIKPNLISLDGNEKPIVDEVAKTYNLKLIVNKGKHIRHDLYTLMTDARLYFRGGNYSKMISEFHNDGIIHYGFSLIPYNENSFASAWKRPTFSSNLYDDLIYFALLPRVPPNGFKLFKKMISKSKMFYFLKKEMEFGLDYFKLKSKKETATWFYHLSRGLTWTYAHLSDLSYFKYPVFILGDKKASELGFKSSAYSNFNKDRLREINQKLFKESNIDYSDNRRFKSLPFIIKDINKIYTEFFKKFFTWLKGLNYTSTDDSQNWFGEIDLKEAKEFRSYFSEDYNTIINSKNSNFRVKRTAVTINDTLMFLENKR